jgi:hypothetical protein
MGRLLPHLQGAHCLAMERQRPLKGACTGSDEGRVGRLLSGCGETSIMEGMVT